MFSVQLMIKFGLLTVAMPQEIHDRQNLPVVGDKGFGDSVTALD